MSKKSASLVFFILLCSIIFSSVVLAQDFDIDHEPIIDTVYAGNAAEFNVIITNNQKFVDTFILDFEDIRFSPLTDPVSHYFNGIRIKPNLSAEVKVLLRPRIDKVPPGKYSLEMQLTSRQTKESATEILELTVEPRPFTPDMIRYGPNMSSSLDIPAKVDPRNPFSVKVNIRNNNPFDFNQIIIKLQSKLINAERTIDLKPDEAKTVEITTELDSKQEPVNDILHAYIYWNNTLIKELKKEYEVVPYLPPFKEEINVSKGFLKTENVIMVFNDANTEKSGKVTFEKGFLSSLFERASPTADIKDMYEWDVTLKPGESATFTVTRSYILWVFILLVIIVGIILYEINKAEVTVSKEVQKVETKEGGLHELKVIITLKNRRRNKIKDVTLLDKVPKLAHLHEKFDIGTIKPTKVYPYAKGNAVKWHIKSLEGFEERIITYSLKSKLSILGSLRLSPTIVDYRKEGEDKLFRVISNSINVSSE